jgi:hypothetical protein
VLPRPYMAQPCVVRLPHTRRSLLICSYAALRSA